MFCVYVDQCGGLVVVVVVVGGGLQILWKCFPQDLQTAVMRFDPALGHESLECQNGTLRLNESPLPNAVNILPFTLPSPRPFPLDLFGWRNSMLRN